jgi:uncharacterized protein YoxC
MKASSSSDSSLTPKARRIDRIAEWFGQHGYGLALAVSLLASLFLIIVLRFSHAESAHSSGLIDDVGNGLNCMLKWMNVPWHGACSYPEEAITLKLINGKLHTPPGLGSGFLQIIGVVAISVMWFFAFLPGNKLHIERVSLATVLSVSAASFVTLIYVVGMFNAYQPAVLMAALIAILTAAEHLSSLEKQTEKLDHQLKLLKGQAEGLGGQTRILESQNINLKQQHESLERVVESVRRISNSTQLSLTETGKEIFIQDVYGAYGRAKTIYAVERDHSIEKEWWEQALESDIHGHGLEKVWDWYYHSPVKKTELTLYHALTRPRVTERDGSKPMSGVSAAYIVSEMPMPGGPDWPPVEDEDENKDKNSDQILDKSRLFDDLLGLAWECLVLDKVRNDLNIVDSIGEWISRPLCWVHATDKEVWQVVKRVPSSDSIVLKTADLIESEENNLDLSLSEKVIESAQAEIRRYLQRGVPAEEYLCAVLCYATARDDQGVLYDDPSSHQYDSRIGDSLVRIHLNAWLATKQPYTRGRCKELAIAIFKEFIGLCWRRSTAGLPEGIARPTNRSLCLAREVL